MKKFLAIAAVLIATQPAAAGERRLSGDYLVAGTQTCVGSPSPSYILYEQRVKFDNRTGLYIFHSQKEIFASTGNLQLQEVRGAKGQKSMPLHLHKSELIVGTLHRFVDTGMDSTGLIVTMHALYADKASNCALQEIYTHVESDPQSD
jgi:hypothetical protein